MSQYVRERRPTACTALSVLGCLTADSQGGDIIVKTQTLATNLANTHNRVRQLTEDVLVLNQYNLNLNSAPVKRAAGYLAQALELVHLANIDLLKADSTTEVTKHTTGAISRRRMKTVAIAASLTGVKGTPLLDKLNPLPVAKEAEKVTPAKAADKKAPAKTAKAKKTPAKADKTA